VEFGLNGVEQNNQNTMSDKVIKYNKNMLPFYLICLLIV